MFQKIFHFNYNLYASVCLSVKVPVTLKEMVTAQQSNNNVVVS